MKPRARRAIAALGVALALAPPGPAIADLVHVPAGPFWMGHDGGPVEEAPAHHVDVPAFRIDRLKVTNAEFARFLEAEGLGSPGGERRFDHDDPDARIHVRDGRWTPDAGFEDHPAVEVSWLGARDYCGFKGGRLPTEAEWEKAARGDDRRPYPWGWEPPTPARAVLDRPYNATAPGHGRPEGRSPSGVEDMLGNLREWTSTIRRPYPYRDDGREGWSGEGEVVVRGASHDDDAATLSVTRRRSYDRRGARAGHHHVGFRCVTSERPGGR